MILIRNFRTRRVLALALLIVVMPSLLAVSLFAADGRKYLLISALVAAFSLLLFACGYDSKSRGARRLALSAVMTALAVIGRFIPIVKPTAAIAIISGVTLGPQTGFLVGSFSAFVSDFFFGQGPWTPFRMIAWGTIGLFGGLFSSVLEKNRALLVGFGGLSGFVFSLIMDVWTVVWYSGRFSPALYLTATVTALPFTLLYAFSNALFLYFLAPSFIKKLGRIKMRYRI